MIESQPIEIQLLKNNRQQMSPSPLQQQHPQHIHFNDLTPSQLNKIGEVQGQCKIKEWQYLKVNYPKGILFAILMTISVVGLLLIKYFRSLRATLFYSKLEESQHQQATDIYVISQDQIQQICDVEQVQLNEVKTNMFQFKHLKYEIMNGKPVPLVLHYSRNLNHFIHDQFHQQGISRDQASKRELFYGKNQHRVQIPNYFEFLFDTMTQPFFIFQYFVSAVYILESLTLFGILMVFFSWFTTTINYFLLRRSYKKIKQTAEKQFPVRVLRNGTFYNIKNIDLVPGDLFVPKGQVPCDSLIVQGQLFVDQASLTGQNIPIAKFKILQPSDEQKSEHWIYQGSTVQTQKEQTLALAINVGYASRRGRIIRKILTKVSRQPDFFKKLIYFMIQVFIVLVIIYLATLGLLLSIQIQTIMVVFRFLDYITYAFPAPFPIYFNAVYSFCLIRLHRDNIIGTECEKTVQSGRMKTICFDKTGTLTQAKMQAKQVFSIKNERQIEDVSQSFKQNQLIRGVFGCCNSVQIINGEAKGDQIDLRLFLLSEAQIEQGGKQGVVRSIRQQRSSWEVIRINQYESKFQSMSVLVRNRQSNKFYILTKGSPQVIHKNSTLKQQKYDQFIKKLSLQGFRSIAFGYRQVNQQNIDALMKAQRADFLKNTRILGVVTFVNLIKTDARQTLDTLTSCDISTKIITGDNIFLGIQTAFMTGMLPQNCSVGVIQGKNYDQNTNSLDLLILSRGVGGQFKQTSQKIHKFQFEAYPNCFFAVDNDFIKVRPDFLHHKIKVFARISPQNKALIVRKHKQLYQTEQQNQSCIQSIFSDCGYKVGMVGDGANDLIAIKQANVGIAIASTDAVYSASFTVQELFQIEQIIRQAKNTQRQVVQIGQFYGVAQLLSLSAILVLTRDASYPTSAMLIWRNFTSMIIIPIIYGLSRPAQALTKYLVNTNFMGLEHHLMFWGNALITTGGYVAAYQYLSNTAVFIPNPNPVVTFQNGYNGQTQSATLMFIVNIPIFLFMAIFIYRSNPWKQPFYKNILLLILFIFNFIQTFFLFFGTRYLGFLKAVEIPIKEAGISLSIIMGVMVIDVIFNLIMQKQAFHQKKYYESRHESQYNKTQHIELGNSQ